MATVNFQLLGNNIYINFSAGRELKLRTKTGFITKPELWKQKQTKFSTKSNRVLKTDLNAPTDDESKVLKSKLDHLEEYVFEKYNEDFSHGIPIDRDWIDNVIKKFTNQSSEQEELLTHHIQNAIDEAPFKKIRTIGGKFKNGLSKGRIKGIIQFKNIILKYEKEKMNGQSIKVKEINKETIVKFEKWMFSKGYSTNYIGKQQANFKSILNDIESIPINIDTKNDIQVVSEEKDPEDIIYLSFDELQRIQELKLDSDYLENARKWLILGCYVGQRASDLLELNKEKIKLLKGRKVFTIKQKKTGKKVTIPILPEAEEIIQSGFPHKISDTKLREYFKKICRLADIDEPKKGRVKESKHGISIDGVYPKWKLIGTHVCRRSFASNFYGKIPTVVLKGITGHSTERMFLKYIGKTDEDFAMQMFEYVEKLPRQNNMRVLKMNKTGTN